jgi:hypothetical protein
VAGIALNTCTLMCIFLGVFQLFESNVESNVFPLFESNVFPLFESNVFPGCVYVLLARHTRLAARSMSVK